jgi:translation initiation factor 5
MPGIVAKVEGQGNGIKTVIVNMVDIARALNREAVCKLIYLIKFFFYLIAQLISNLIF